MRTAEPEESLELTLYTGDNSLTIGGWDNDNEIKVKVQSEDLDWSAYYISASEAKEIIKHLEYQLSIFKEIK